MSGMVTLQFILYNLTFLLVTAHFLDSAKCDVSALPFQF